MPILLKVEMTQKHWVILAFIYAVHVDVVKISKSHIRCPKFSKSEFIWLKKAIKGHDKIQNELKWKRRKKRTVSDEKMLRKVMVVKNGKIEVAY